MTGPRSMSSPPPSPSTAADRHLPTPGGSLTLAFFTRSMASACSSGLVPNTCRVGRCEGPGTPKAGLASVLGPHRAEETHRGGGKMYLSICPSSVSLCQCVLSTLLCVSVCPSITPSFWACLSACMCVCLCTHVCVGGCVLYGGRYSGDGDSPGRGQGWDGQSSPFSPEEGGAGPAGRAEPVGLTCCR